MEELSVFGLPVEVNMEKNKVYIWDICHDLTDAETEAIVRYLFLEGFIEGQEVECIIVREEDQT